MLLSYSICQRDEAIAGSTLEWMIQLDGKLDYDCILTLASAVDREPFTELAKRLFKSVTVLECDGPEAWPNGKNYSFQSLVRHLDNQRCKESFLWLEPDAIPLRKGWLTAIEEEHKRGGKPFTGYVYDQIGFMDCVGVYPPDFMEYSPTNGMLCRAASWDRCCGAEIIQYVNRANHLFQMVHDIDGFPPTFGTGGQSLDYLRKDAVLFHRNKDGTLIHELSKGKIQRFIGGLFKHKEVKQQERIVVVLPVCAKDVHQAIAHAQWLRKLGVKWVNKAIIAFDGECPPEAVTELNGLLTYTFSMVETFMYPVPTDKKYPAVANYAFARVAEYMASGTASWLWLEADCVILRKDWLEVLQKEYDACGKKFMGPIVSGMGHCNGVAVYPPDAIHRISPALHQPNAAFDFAMKDYMIRDCHDASNVITHIWGLTNGIPTQTDGTNPPQKITAEIAKKLIRPNAVMIHRIKDTSLTELLMAGGAR